MIPHNILFETSGTKFPDTTRTGGAGQGKSPTFYLRLALKSKHVRYRERKLIESLLKAYNEFSSQNQISENSEYSMTLFDYLISENEDTFIDFIDSAIFSSQASYEAWQEEGFIIEDKKEGAKTIFRELKENRDRYRLVITMKNRKGSGVVFKDLLTGKTLLPRKWGIVKHIPPAKLMIVRIDNGKVTRILSH